TTVTADPREGHAWGELDGPSARGIARDMAGEFAEMAATRVILDRVAPQADADLVAFYGPPDRPTDAFLRQFTRLQHGLQPRPPSLSRSQTLARRGAPLPGPRSPNLQIDAGGGGRTHTTCVIRPSNVRVCQFRHARGEGGKATGDRGPGQAVTVSVLQVPSGS